MSERIHFNWAAELDALGRDRTAQRILHEGKHPGKIFDGSIHREEVLNVLAEEVEIAELVGLAGSRARRTHTPLQSDTDILVVTPFAGKMEGVAILPQQEWKGTGGHIHIIRITPNNYLKYKNMSDGTEEGNVLHNLLEGTQWLWAISGQIQNITLSNRKLLEQSLLALER